MLDAELELDDVTGALVAFDAPAPFQDQSELRPFFVPHGESICASGCALSHHPTPSFTKVRFEQLVEQLASPDRTRAIDELLFYGPQTLSLLESKVGQLVDSATRTSLLTQLRRTRVVVSVRMIDAARVRRAWFDEQVVRLDRRYVYAMQCKQLPAQVVSGTVKRVGLDYVWFRL